MILPVHHQLKLPILKAASSLAPVLQFFQISLNHFNIVKKPPVLLLYKANLNF